MSGQPARTHEDIEAQITAIQAKRAQQGDQEDVPKENERIGLTETGVFDQDIYGGKGKFEGYVTSIASKEDEEDDEEAAAPEKGKRMPNYTAPRLFSKTWRRGRRTTMTPSQSIRSPQLQAGTVNIRGGGCSSKYPQPGWTSSLMVARHLMLVEEAMLRS